MSQYHEYLYQKSRLIDYIDQISGGLFQIHRILTTYFPDADVSAVIKIQNIMENELQTTINSVQDHNGINI
jgi:hypothetical protein